MKTDQNLIFEAYAKTLNEGSHLYGDTELGPGKYKASDVTITDYDIEGLTPVGVGGGYENVPVEFEDDNGTTMTGIVDSLYIDDIRGGLDASGMIHDAEVGTLEEDDNDQYTPEDAPADDQLGGLEPLDTEGDEAEENSSEDIVKALQDIVGELKTLNQYADFMSTGTRAQGFTGGVQKQKGQL
jgi:hypothetical protein